MFVTYSNGEEVIITTKDSEGEMLHVWFTHGGRNADEYDREEFEESDAAVRVRSSLDVD
jgi:hypothetical protein